MPLMRRDARWPRLRHGNSVRPGVCARRPVMRSPSTGVPSLAPLRGSRRSGPLKLKFLPILALLLVAGFTRADVLRAASPDSWPLPPPGPSYGAIGNCAEYIYCQTADFSVYGTGYVNDWLYQGPELWEMN